MGYTNYFKQHRAFSGEEWNAIVTSAKAVVAEAEKSSVALADWNGREGEPEFSESRIAFNGAGDERHESFALNHSPEKDAFDFCKTERKPYDGVVKAVLARAHFIAPDAVDFQWDGDIDEYVNGADVGSPSAAKYVQTLWPDHYDAMLARTKRCVEYNPDNTPWPEPWFASASDAKIELDPGEPPSRRGPGSNQYQDKPPRPRR
ncbi:MAG: hypothetical protein ACYDEP_12145 [Acidimicrobiales bacterium]